MIKRKLIKTNIEGQDLEFVVDVFPGTPPWTWDNWIVESYQNDRPLVLNKEEKKKFEKLIREGKLK